MVLLWERRERCAAARRIVCYVMLCYGRFAAKIQRICTKILSYLHVRKVCDEDTAYLHKDTLVTGRDTP